MISSVREAAKKALLLMAGPVRSNPPPSLDLNGRWDVGKKVIFSLIALYFNLPPPS